MGKCKNAQMCPARAGCECADVQMWEGRLFAFVGVITNKREKR